MPKPEKKRAVSSSSSDDSDSGPEDRTPAKKPKTASSSKGEKGENGEIYFNLDKNKRATVREFKGKLYVDIREFYLKDDKMLPGKKGISLPITQWRALLELADDINQVIESK